MIPPIDTFIKFNRNIPVVFSPSTVESCVLGVFSLRRLKAASLAVVSDANPLDIVSATFSFNSLNSANPLRGPFGVLGGKMKDGSAVERSDGNSPTGGRGVALGPVKC